MFRVIFHRHWPKVNFMGIDQYNIKKYVYCVKLYCKHWSRFSSDLTHIRAFRNLNNYVISWIPKCTTYHLLWNLRPHNFLLWFQMLYSEKENFHNFQKYLSPVKCYRRLKSNPRAYIQMERKSVCLCVRERERER